ncbi:hypothetical protein KKA17_07130, partial [bacterium]|nr:hypothetical protein [bacterium]
ASWAAKSEPWSVVSLFTFISTLFPVTDVSSVVLLLESEFEAEPPTLEGVKPLRLRLALFEVDVNVKMIFLSFRL